jgi:hypothetical protein
MVSGMAKEKKPFPNETWWTDRRGRRWRVEIKWAPVAGRAEPVAVMIEASPGEVVTGETLKGIRFAELADRMRQAAAFAHASVASDPQRDLTAEQRSEYLSTAELLLAHKGRTLTNDDLGEVARVYRQAHRIGANPRVAVREQFHLSDSGAAKRIRAARDAGLLGPARPGKAGEV